ncbi:uncharacterized protein LOC135848117 [Planococcus citri]|uniref:uncharacterized protein LOC135848117 n=1 Tax=Planococcus citri TaxID=170843 RepID=UPI0031F830DF
MGLPPNFADDFAKLMGDVSGIKSSVEKIQTDVDKIISDIQNLQSTTNDHKNRLQDLEEENSELWNKIEEMEQYSRKNNIIINGIPYQEDENLHTIIKNLGDKLETNVSEGDINATHRLPTKKRGQIPPIIVRLNKRSVKDQMIRKSREKRINSSDLDFSQQPPRPIYVSEHLTSFSMSLLSKGVELKKKKLIAGAWSNDGKIFIRPKENDKPIRITQEDQLAKYEHKKGQAKQTAKSKHK